MPHRAAACLLLLAFSLAPAPASAQAPAPDPPGPWVVDLRGALAGLPDAAAFYPVLPADAVVPSRAFGFDLGGHVYFLKLGPSRVGLGASYIRATATAMAPRPVTSATTPPSGTAARLPPDVTARIITFAPQLSFNFGTADGWSYLSAGAGWGRTETSAAREGGPVATVVSGRLQSIHYGGGARWFLSRHLAAGFDLRFHKLTGRTPPPPAAPTPATTVTTLSIGMSLR